MNNISIFSKTLKKFMEFFRKVLNLIDSDNILLEFKKPFFKCPTFILLG